MMRAVLASCHSCAQGVRECPFEVGFGPLTENDIRTWPPNLSRRCDATCSFHLLLGASSQPLPHPTLHPLTLPSQTPLILAAQNGYLEIVRLLIRNGARVDKTGVRTIPPSLNRLRVLRLSDISFSTQLISSHLIPYSSQSLVILISFSSHSHLFLIPTLTRRIQPQHDVSVHFYISYNLGMSIIDGD